MGCFARLVMWASYETWAAAHNRVKDCGFKQAEATPWTAFQFGGTAVEISIVTA